MIIPNSFVNLYIAVAFIVCFASLRRSGWLDKLLEFLGKHSTNIWLIHTFFCYYLFKDFIYSFKYPALIFIVLLLCSLAASYIVNLIYVPINKRIHKALR